MEQLTFEKIKALIGERKPTANKGDNGRALIIAGSELMSGAALMCAAAALRAGVGTLKAVVPNGARQAFYSVPECMCIAFGGEKWNELDESCAYPLHVGVTEVGGGMEGIVRSAAGIGTLLMEGIGDTIRVSLTGDPEREVETGIELLKAVELRAQGLHLVCCPTCGRCGNVAKHSEIYERVKAEFKREKRPLKIAVMGCAVNGPGEAKEADIGLALGRTNAVLFKKGEQIAAYDIDTAEEELIRQAKQMLEGK